MAFNGEDYKVTQTEIDANGVTGMPDIPGLSAHDMQQAFDKLATFIATRYNELMTALANDDSGVPAITDMKQAIADAEFESGSGDMLRAIYDTQDKQTDLYEYTDEAVAERSPINHASPDATYGLGSDAEYGHIKVTPGNGLGIDSGTLSISAATTAAPGAVQLNSAINSASATQAATPSAVKAAYDRTIDRSISWTQPPLQNSFTQDTNNPFGYKKYTSGWVQFTGGVKRSTAPGANMTIATLPEGIRPNRFHSFMIFQPQGWIGSAGLLSNGSITTVSGNNFSGYNVNNPLILNYLFKVEGQ